LPRGIWVWLVLLVPLLIGIAIVVLWIKLMKDDDEPAPKHEVDQTNDSFGIYNVVKPTPPWERKTNKKPVVFIDMDEMPQMRPLGLELKELKVTRVHSAGAQWGWQVGDKIVQIAGQPVHTFEELWERIQNERDRCPVRFMVERGEETQDPIEEVFERVRLARNPAQVAPEPSPESLEAGLAGAGAKKALPKEVAELRPPAQAWAQHDAPVAPSGTGGLPSALVGWESWAAPVESEEAPKKRHDRAEIARKAGVERSQLGTTRFMREFPLTTGERLKRTLQGRAVVGQQDVRYKVDGWGRSVVQVGDQGRSIISCGDS